MKASSKFKAQNTRSPYSLRNSLIVSVEGHEKRLFMTSIWETNKNTTQWWRGGKTRRAAWLFLLPSASPLVNNKNCSSVMERRRKLWLETRNSSAKRHRVSKANNEMESESEQSLVECSLLLFFLSPKRRKVYVPSRPTDRQMSFIFVCPPYATHHVAC